MDITPDLLTAIWCIRKWYFTNPEYSEKETEHLLECGLKKCDIKFGVYYGGYCDTCSYSEEAVIFTVTCNCGQSKYKDFNLSEYHANGFSLPIMLEEINDIEKELCP